jgi:hypothetical protein
MPGQWCEPLPGACELLELGAVCVVLGVVPVVVCVELAALAIAAPPPAAAPVTASTVSILVIWPRIMLHLLSVVGRWTSPTIRPRDRRVVASR